MKYSYTNFFRIISCLLVLYICLSFIKSGISTSSNFDKTYLVNLERRPDRYEKFMNAYDESDMNFVPISKINAVDGTDIDIEKVPLSEIAKGELKQIETTGFRSKHYQLTRGAIGCYLSHVKVWKDIIESNQKHGLIFEDDVKLPLNINTKITKSMQHVPDDWDIILFGFHCKDCEKKINYRKVNRFILLHCYAISRNAIVKILKTNSLFPITQQIDSYLSELSADILNIYTVKNPIIHQNGSRTDIQMPLISNLNAEARLKVDIKAKK